MKRKLSSILAIVLATALLASCGQGEAAPAEPSQADEGAASETVSESDPAAGDTSPADIGEPDGDTVSVTDMLGRQVEIPATLERVITDRILPFPSTYFVATGTNMEEILAMHPASKSAAVNSMLNIMAPAVSDAKTDIFDGNEPNIEEVLKLSPDVVFALADEPDSVENYADAGITALGIKAASAAGGDAIETLRGWFEVLAYTGGRQDAVDSILSEGEEAKATIAAALEGVEEKPSAIFLFSHDGNNMEVAGADFFSQYWLSCTGAEDPASADFSGRNTVNMEQIYAWDPDIIYITNFTSILPEDLYNNTIDGQDWSTLKAVQNKQVYKVPLGIYRWFPPSGDTPLMLKWLAQKNHPELFTYDMNEETKAYYKAHYDYDLTETDLEYIFNPGAAAAAGYSAG